jgi:hypothetical protein
MFCGRYKPKAANPKFRRLGAEAIKTILSHLFVFSAFFPPVINKNSTECYGKCAVFDSDL